MGTGLVGGPHITTDEMQALRFSSVVIGGYRVTEVEAFRRRVVAERERLARALAETRTVEQELREEVLRLRQMLEEAPQGPADQGAYVLRAAQQTAETIAAQARQQAQRTVAGAQAEAAQLTEHARQQAGEMLNRARQEAAAERSRLIEETAGEARREADFYSRLVALVRDGLTEQAAVLTDRLAEWDKQAREGLVPAPAA